jgi:hypothetical protein
MEEMRKATGCAIATNLHFPHLSYQKFISSQQSLFVQHNLSHMCIVLHIARAAKLHGWRVLGASSVEFDLRSRAVDLIPVRRKF